MGREVVDAALVELGDRLGMPGLKFDAAGACQLLFDQRWLVTLMQVPSFDGVGLNCPLTPAGAAGRLGAGALGAMLRANFHASGGGETLSIGPDERAYLQRVVPLADSGGEGVQRALERLLDQAEAWAERLARPEPAGDAAHARVQSSTDWAMQRV